MRTRKRRALPLVLVLCLALLAPLAPPSPALADPSAPLLPPIAENGGDNFLLSADGRLVGFRPDRASASQIYTVPTDGSAPPAPLPGVLGEVNYLTAIAGGRVLYTATGASIAGFGLVSAPLDGLTPPVILLDELTQIVGVQTTVVGDRVIITAVTYIDGQFADRTFNAPLDGSAPPTLVAPVGSWIMPGWKRIVYSEGEDLYSVPLAGPVAARTRLATVAPGGTVTPFYKVSDDGTSVAFGSGGRIYAVPSDGSGQPKAVSPALASGQRVNDYWITPDGRTVVVAVESYLLSGGVTVAQIHLYSAPTDGSAPPVRLTGSPIRITPGEAFRPAVSPDSRTVAFTGEGAGEFELLIATLGMAGSATRLASGPAPSPPTIAFLDPSHVLAALPWLTVYNLEPPRSAMQLPFTIEQLSYQRLVAGDRLIFGGCSLPCLSSEEMTLFSLPFDGPASAAARLGVRVPKLQPWFSIAADGRVVYAADNDGVAGVELYSVPSAPIGVGFVSEAAQRNEGDEVRLEVALDRAAAQPVSVGYTIEGLGAPRAGELTFAPGVVTQTIDLQLAADGVFTGDWAVRVSLVPPDGVAPLVRDRVGFTVRDAEALHHWVPFVTVPRS